MSAPLLDADKILEMNDKIEVFEMVSVDSTSDTDTRLFVVKKPKDALELEHSKRIEISSRLCGRCDSALRYFAYYVDLFKSGGKDAVNEAGIKPACVLHENVETFQPSCHLCATIASYINLHWKFSANAVQESSVEMSWQAEGPFWKPGEREDGDDVKASLSKKGPARLHVSLAHPSKRTTQTYLGILRFQILDQERYLRLLRNVKALERFDGAGNELDLPVAKQTQSETTRNLATYWMALCEANRDGRHHECNRLGDGVLPTRLLDVMGALETGYLRLATAETHPEIFQKGSMLQYITLSHCWGEWGASELPSLTTSNAAERRETGLAMDAVPKTFRDAVEITDWFGVKWLWIDSLCIQQDSRLDWQFEASHMSQVYRNAVLNISADASFDARGGCFRNRHPAAVTPIAVGLPETKDSDFLLAVDDEHCFESVTLAPISDRAWCFQERQLARRVLHFTDTEVIWECCAEGKYFASETYPNGMSVNRLFDKKPKFQSHGKLAGKTLYRTWNEMCKTYSERELTKPTDKLVALSGLAKEIWQLIPGDGYVAGLWRSTLPLGLLWKASSQARYSKSQGYIAPSWSWVSINGKIGEMWADERALEEEEKREVAVADILDVSVDPVVASEVTAALRSATMTVKGLLRRVSVRPDEEEKPWYMLAVGGGQVHELEIHDGGRKVSTMHGGPSQEGSFDFSFDSERDKEKSDEPAVDAYFLPIALQQGEESKAEGQDDGAKDDAEGSGNVEKAPRTIKGLLLEWTGHENRFCRIGTLDVSGTYIHPMLYKLKEQENDGRQGKDEDEGADRWSELFRKPDGRPSVEHPAADEQAPGDAAQEAAEALYRTTQELNTDLFERVGIRTIELV